MANRKAEYAQGVSPSSLSACKHVLSRVHQDGNRANSKLFGLLGKNSMELVHCCEFQAPTTYRNNPNRQRSTRAPRRTHQPAKPRRVPIGMLPFQQRTQRHSNRGLAISQYRALAMSTTALAKMYASSGRPRQSSLISGSTTISRT